MAATVHDDHRIVRRQRLYLVAPIVGVCQAAVQQDYRGTRAVNTVMETDTVCVGLPSTCGANRCRRWWQQLPALGSAGTKREQSENYKQMMRCVLLQHDSF